LKLLIENCFPTFGRGSRGKNLCAAAHILRNTALNRRPLKWHAKFPRGMK